MTDPTNDIDALLDYLKLIQPYPRWADSLTALVAERDALKQRVAYLEALSKPLYIPHGQRVESIDLRERLVCAALTGILANYESRNHGADDVAEWAVLQADATLAAMRKGDTNG